MEIKIFYNKDTGLKPKIYKDVFAFTDQLDHKIRIIFSGNTPEDAAEYEVKKVHVTNLSSTRKIK